MFDGIIFDLDGTLVDSEALCNRAYLSLLPQLALSEAEMVARFRGRKLAEVLAEIEILIGAPLAPGFEARYRAEVARLFRSSLTAFPGVHAALAQLQLPICIASSGPPAKITDALRVTRLAPFFGPRLYSSYDIQSWKPEPDLFLFAAARMGLRPEACLVVEDSLPGVQAAQAAGMAVLQHGSHLSPQAGVEVFTDYIEFLPAITRMARRLR